VTKAEAQQRALRWLKTASVTKGELFVFGRDAKILRHSNPRMEGASIADLRDLKGRLIARAMRDDQLSPDGDSAVFSLGTPEEKIAGKHMAHFAAVPEWQWTVGAAVGFSDIEAESQKKMDQILSVLSRTLTKIRIAESGYVFLFRGDKRILIEPPGSNGQSETATETRREVEALLATLMRASQERSPRAEPRAVRYADPFSASRTLVDTYVEYFKAFDWYVALVAPVAEIQAPATKLLLRQSLLIGAITFSGLVGTLILAARISRPLHVLASYAKKLPARDFTVSGADDHSVRALSLGRRDEVGRLAEA
jgi:hypothetical protein